jgi:NAD(P)H-hydrate epimerase
MQPRIQRAIPRLPKRSNDSNKGDYGRVLVVAGSTGMLGAPAMVGLAALRSGCGLAQVAVPGPIQQSVAILVPCATTLPLPTNAAGVIDARAVQSLRPRIREWANVVAFGPGMRRSREGVRLVSEILRISSIPIVLDADGLNNAADNPNSLTRSRNCELVLTPHPLEAQRLLDALKLRTNALTHRTIAALALANRTKSVVVLKGHQTIVTDGVRLYTNHTGNPGMATGGSGDVLTGIIAALIAQHLPTFDAAVLGVHIHGKAGDLAASKLGQVSLIATDLIDHLPNAFLTLRPR